MWKTTLTDWRLDDYIDCQGPTESQLQLYDLNVRSQDDPWPTPSYMEQLSASYIPERNGYYAHTAKASPWKPILEFEHAAAKPSLADYTSHEKGMSTGSLKFPNIVTGFERNPGHQARAALYTRFTPLEWTQEMLRLCNEADTNKNSSERLRGDSVRIMRETEEKTAQGQRESGRRLGERITDITFWRNELRSELERLIAESNLLQDQYKATVKAANDIEGPLHIAQECLYQREKREGIDLVHDIVEQSLLKELDLYRRDQDKLKSLASRIRDQMRDNRAAQHDLELDVISKDNTIGIDAMCHHLNNYSKGINYYGGIERHDPTISNTVTWAENSSRKIQRSQAERGKSAQMRSEATNLINMCATEIWDAWNNTNNALERRSSETLECKSKIQMELHKTQQEIFDLEKYIELLKRSIMDKSLPMKVAQTRLEARTHRKTIELCRDNAQDRLMYEVKDLQDSIEALHRKFQEAEAQHQLLLKTRSNLEHDLHKKFNSLFIDREKCMSLRRSFPISAIIKY